MEKNQNGKKVYLISSSS